MILSRAYITSLKFLTDRLNIVRYNGIFEIKLWSELKYFLNISLCFSTFLILYLIPSSLFHVLQHMFVAH